jgi:DNA-binding transcriptional regulator YiaG
MDNNPLHDTNLILKERLLKFRKKLGLTQTEAGELFGVQLRTWQEWETGNTTPSRTSLILLEQYETNPPIIPDTPNMCSELRKKLGLNKGEMAGLFDVQPNTWGYWERGVKKPKLSARNKIKKMLKEINENPSYQNEIK